MGAPPKAPKLGDPSANQDSQTGKATEVSQAAELATERQKISDLESQLQESKRCCAENDRKLQQAEEYGWWLWVSQLPCTSYCAEYSVEQVSVNSPLFKLITKLVQSSCAQHRRKLGSEEFCPAPVLELQSIAA